MATTDDLQIRIRADIGQAQNGLNQLRRALLNATNPAQIRAMVSQLNALSRAQLNSSRTLSNVARANSQNLKKGLSDLNQYASSFSASLQNIGRSYVRNVTMPIVKGLAACVKASMDFKQQLSATGAIAQATETEMKGLEDQSIQLGIKTKYTAMEVAQGQEQMIKAGRNVKQVFTEMEDVLNLATAGNIEIARSAEMASNVVNMFAKQNLSMANAANLMAAADNKSATNLELLYSSLQYVGPVAASLNIPMQDLVATIGVLGNNAIKGSKAGTGLRQLLMRLQPASDKAAKTMYNLGIITKSGTNAFYDSQGKVKSLATVINILRDSVTGLTDEQKQDALKNMFGLIASPTVLSLLNADTNAINNMSNAMSNVSVADIAAKKLDNFAGQVELLRGSVETFMIKIGNLLTPILRKIVKLVTNVVNVFLRMPDSISRILVVMALLVAAIGPIILGFGTLGIAITGFIALIGGSISAITAIAGIISTVGIPAILGITAAITISIAEFTALAYIITSKSAQAISSLIPVKDTFLLLKNVISGDLSNAFNILVNNFDMTKNSANSLLDRFKDIREKAYQIYKVITANLSTAFKILTGDFSKSIDSMSGFSKSTDESKKNAVNMFTTIINYAEKFVNRIYSILDTFNLIPVEVKYANNQTALSYIKLTASVQDSLEDLSVLSKNFAKDSTKENKKMYEQQLANVKSSLDAETKFVSQQLKKKQDTQNKAAESLFKNSKVLSDKQEKEILSNMNKNHSLQTSTIESYNAIILAIETSAFNQKRAKTAEEQAKINSMRSQMENAGIGLVSNSTRQQLAILAEARNLKVNIAREEGLAIIAEANKTFDAVVLKATEEKQRRLSEIVMLRDESKVISKEQADAMIGEATRTYADTVETARNTKNETVTLAVDKANGTITQAERETRDLQTQGKNVKKAMIAIWESIKEEVPPIVEELANIIIEKFGTAFKNALQSQISNAWENYKLDVKEEFTGKKATIARMPAVRKTPKVSTSYTPYGIPKYASGTNYAEGGLSLVGKRLPTINRVKSVKSKLKLWIKIKIIQKNNFKILKLNIVIILKMFNTIGIFSIHKLIRQYRGNQLDCERLIDTVERTG